MFWKFGGKNRTKLGGFLDRNGFTQNDLEKTAKLSRPTVSKACNDKEYIPSPTVMKKILKVIRQIKPNVKSTDFWDM
ncbi:helix-turn-helix transcriptional regulator [Bacillus mycoides]|uniref:Transcriptional regulator n=1 Tax=Bacillus thuringiensis serovar navarrensis TaxID=339658 RepID=A0A243ADR2_BACTU|nr:MULTISPECIES: helix-turn-helix transcriptional regulator [Bacillus cereus group]MED1267047.1 helix-turn-helix transcriptional regulator [Bacillus mycoides]OTY18474.1 transcriptional regulator [Bacillus thuringiensis serovar navarrensis]